jgi:hypothetical protein
MSKTTKLYFWLVAKEGKIICIDFRRRNIMRKLSILIFLMFTLLLSGTSQAVSVDVTSPGDAIKGYPDNSNWPGGEHPGLVIDDNPGTKFLHFDGDNETSGFQVTAAISGKVVTEITLTTGNDAPERDPVVVEVSGSNAGIDGPYTLIATVNVTDFDQVDPWPRNTKNATPLTFANAVAYDHYQVLFTVIRVPENGCCMQVSEVELLADVTPPAGWGLKDVGNPAKPGSAIDEAGTWTVRGSGHDIWGNNDGFYYVFRPLAGDGSLELKLLSAGNTNAGGWSKVGPMIRETTQAGSKHAVMTMTGANGLQFVYRQNTDEGSGGVQRTGEVLPEWLRITRTGDLLLGEFGLEVPWLPGIITWTPVGEPTAVTMNADVTIGLAVSASNNDALNMAVLDNITLTAPPYLKAWDLSPADGTTRVSFTPTLSWMPGDGATSHDVYLGLEGAMTLVSSQALGNESYTPGAPLLGNTTYEWQIVEQPGGVAGPVLSFTTLYEPPWYMGSLNWERWNGMPWEEIMRMVDGVHYLLDPADDYGEVPDAYQPSTEGPVDYGVRLSGHLVPGTSGDYTFWVAGDDGTMLRLKTDADCTEMTRIAWHYRYSGNPDANPEQKSVPISLVGGQKYAIEILLKERGGGDWVEAYWEGPDSPSRSRISGTFLTSAYAVNPRPETGTSITPLEATTFSWTAGKFATSQEVLFGTSPGTMAPIATLPANPAVLAEHTTLAMPAVAAGNTYYWQVNSTDGTDTWTGDVWCFKVSDWVHRNIGIDPINEDAPEPPLGYSTYDAGTDTTVVAAGGHELWGDNDEFAYRYTTVKMTRDTGVIQARIHSITPADSWRRGGIQIRENLGVASRKFMMHKTGHNNLRAQFRDNWRSGTGSTGDNWGLPYPMWLRVTRDHNRFEAYFSEDGENWTHAGGRTINMAPDNFVYVGFAQCHHPGVDQSGLSTGVFDSWSYTTPDIKQSWNLQPPNGSTMVDIHATLSWGAGEGATEHRVYFSADEEAVVNRTVDPIVLPAETLSVEVGPLTMGQVYYWCVDEVSNPVTPGEVVSFTAETYRTIDDFEDYTIIPEPLPEQVLVPGEIIEAVPPPDQSEVVPGHTIPGYTVVAEAPDAGCLIADWAFEGNYDDTSGSGFHGTPVGDATIVADATRGNVLSLDSDGDYVDCGNPAALNFSTGNWSISAWTKTTMTGTGDDNKGTIIANGADSGGGHRYCLILSEQSEGKVNLVIDDNAGDGIGSSHNKKQFTAGTTINDDVWHHTLGVRDGDQLLIYTDGVPDGSISIPADYDLSGTVQSNVLIGAISKADAGFSIYKDYGGLIDDAQIYNCALTEGNARFMAGLGDLVVPPVEVPPLYGPLVAHYEFEGNANDSTDNHYDGSLIGDASIVDGTMVLDGSGDAVTIDGYKGILGKNAFTISAWLKKTNQEDSSIVSWGKNASRQRVDFRLNNIRLRMEHGAGNIEGESNWVANGEWHHVAVTVSENATIGPPGVTLYLDGLNDTRTDTDSDAFNIVADKDVGIGYRATHNNRWYNGTLDDVRIYNYELSHGEIRHIGGFGDLVLIPDSYQPLIGHWTADR